MKPSAILHTFFKMSQFNVIEDKRRKAALLDCIDALNNKATLTLTGLGRRMQNKHVATKHNIKRVCRLLGNTHLQRERSKIYAFVARHFLHKLSNPVIIIDWSPVKCVDKQLLRASFPIGGRSITLYEEIFTESKLASPAAHKSFISKLKVIIPDECNPIIMADAGFKVPWFKLIEKQGWYWLGRVRGNSYLTIAGKGLSCQKLFKEATHQPQHLGLVELTQQHLFKCNATLYKKRSKGRHKKGYRGNIAASGHSIKHAKGQREPWLLVSNLPEDTWPATRLVSLYKLRMQIEESFRDTKSERYGQSLSFTGSRCIKRLEILLLIGMLSQVAYLLIGKAAYIKGYYKQFQANTVRNRRVLSYFYLGVEIAKHSYFSFTFKDICIALSGLKAQAEGEFR